MTNYENQVKSLGCCAEGFFLSNFVIARMWGLFICPVFLVSQITMVQCMGISLVVRYVLRYEGLSFDKITEDKSLAWIHAYVFGRSILAPLFVWLSGIVIASFL